MVSIADRYSCSVSSGFKGSRKIGELIKNSKSKNVQR